MVFSTPKRALLVFLKAMRSMELRAAGVTVYSSNFDPKTGAIVRVVEVPDRWGDTAWEKDPEFGKRYPRRRFGWSGGFSPVPETVDIAITDRCSFGCTYCLTPETPVLGADLLWRPISSVTPGDVLVGFDEFADGRQHRKLRPSVVQAVRVTTKPVLRIITDSREILTTGNHGWLQHRVGHGHRWQAADQLRTGLALSFFGEPSPALEPTDDYRAGYLAGMTLGDGTFRFEPGWRGWNHGFPQAYWRVALKDEQALGRLVAYLAHFGVETNIRPFNAGPKAVSPMQKVEIRSIPKLEVIHTLVSTSIDTPEFQRGFLAGFFDAEGSHRGSLRYSHKETAPLERVVRYASMFGFQFQVERPGQGSVASTARLIGTVSDRMRFLGLIRPAITRKTADWAATSMETNGETIRSIEKVGAQDVVDIQTSSATFFAAGLATHNCYMDSTPSREHAPKELIEKVVTGFDQPPYQIAIGGGEPTGHPDFPWILRRARELGTVPNYTTNGQKFSQRVIDATNTFCGGVAMTFHSFKGFSWFREHYLRLRDVLKVQVNVHVIADKDVAKNLLALTSDPTLGKLRIVLLAYYPDVGRAAMDTLITKRVYQKHLPSAVKRALAIGHDVAFSEGLLPYFLSRPEIGVNTSFAMRSEGIFSCFIDTKGRMSGSSFNPPVDSERFKHETVWETSSQKMWDDLSTWKGRPHGSACYDCKFISRCATPHQFHYLMCNYDMHNQRPLKAEYDPDDDATNVSAHDRVIDKDIV